MLVIRGSANRNLTGVFSFVPDDAFGQASLTTNRKFEIVLRDGHEQNSVLSGMPLLLGVDSVTSGSATARLTLGAQFARFQGSRSESVARPIRPVFVVESVDNLRYRGEVSTSFAATEMSVFTDDDSDPVVTRVDATTFRFDWQCPSFALAADPHTDAVFFRATGRRGEDRSKEADIDIVVNSLQMTTDDPYQAFPSFGCEEAISWCLQLAKQAGNTDLGHCGSYRDVSRCVWPTSEEACLFEGPSPFSVPRSSARATMASRPPSSPHTCATSSIRIPVMTSSPPGTEHENSHPSGRG